MYPTFLPISGQMVVCLFLADRVQYIATREAPRWSGDIGFY